MILFFISASNVATARTVAPQLFADQYHEFSKSVSIDDVVSVAERVMCVTAFDDYRDKIMQDLRKGGLSPSSKMLMFTYKCLFAVILGKSPG